MLPATLRVRDGRQVTLREILPQDKAHLQAAFACLSADSRYTRFMATMRDLPNEMLEAATHPAPDREFALVAVSAPGPDEIIVGGARYAAEPGSDTCEFAVTVADDWHGQGLAPRLMEALIAAAQARGLRSMMGYVLATNASMRKLAKRLGFHDSPMPEDATVRVVSLRLGGDQASA
jgi:RimJ/RimL family protein N-acetyltransferase